MDERLIDDVKSACVVLGVRKKGQNYPFEIYGTGFVVDPEGFLITANHVESAIKNRLKELNQEKKEYEFTASIVAHDGEIPSLTTAPIEEKRTITLVIDDLIEYLPKDHDIKICRMVGKWINLPYLKLKKPTRLKVHQDIAIVGYPSGKSTLNIFDQEYGLRMSPIIQIGKISSLMPTDKTIRPFGLFTDVIGVGGSSGSPIVDSCDGEVLGIAQHVVPAKGLNQNNEWVINVNLGLVWGVTTYFLYDVVHKMIIEQKKIVDEYGHRLVDDDYLIKIEFPAGEGSFPDLPPK